MGTALNAREEKTNVVQLRSDQEHVVSQGVVGSDERPAELL